MGGYRTPFVAQTAEEDWTVVTRHINPSKWSAGVGRQGRQRWQVPEKLFRKSFLGDRAFSACKFRIQKGRDICLEPSPSVHGNRVDEEYPDRMIRGICEKLDVEVSCLKNLLSRDDYKP